MNLIDLNVIEYQLSVCSFFPSHLYFPPTPDAKLDKKPRPPTISINKIKCLQFVVKIKVLKSIIDTSFIDLDLIEY